VILTLGIEEEADDFVNCGVCDGHRASRLFVGGKVKVVAKGDNWSAVDGVERDSGAIGLEHYQIKVAWVDCCDGDVPDMT
jgi:hypothetical protein